MSDAFAERRARSALVVAAAVSSAGIAVAGTVSRNVGGVLLVLGWLAFVYALHSFGRAGAPPSEKAEP